MKISSSVAAAVAVICATAASADTGINQTNIKSYGNAIAAAAAAQKATNNDSASMAFERLNTHLKEAKVVQFNGNLPDYAQRSFEASKRLSKELQPQDKMDNFEIQQLMSDHNQAESAAQSVQKKLNDSMGPPYNKI